MVKFIIRHKVWFANGKDERKWEKVLSKRGSLRLNKCRTIHTKNEKFSRYVSNINFVPRACCFPDTGRSRTWSDVRRATCNLANQERNWYLINSFTFAWQHLRTRWLSSGRYLSDVNIKISKSLQRSKLIASLLGACYFLFVSHCLLILCR